MPVEKEYRAESACNACGVTLSIAGILHRQNELGVSPIWACSACNKVGIDPQVDEITKIIQKG